MEHVFSMWIHLFIDVYSGLFKKYDSAINITRSVGGISQQYRIGGISISIIGYKE